MSTPAQHIPPLASNLERRFYPRVAPHAPLFVALSDGESNQSLVLNVSENGLLLSTPSDLRCNFVTRVSLALNTLPNPVQVTVRVVWANEDRKLAGIQLLNLSEHDRERIRKWAAQESAQSQPSEPGHPAIFVEPFTTLSETGQETRSFAEEMPTNEPPEPVSLAPLLLVPSRLNLTVVRRVILATVIATACLAIALFLKGGALGKVFAHFTENRSLSAAAAPLAQASQESLENTKTSKPAATSQAASPRPIINSAKSEGALPSKSALQNSPVADEDSAHLSPARHAPHTGQNPRDTSRTETIPSSDPASETDRTPGLPEQMTENQIGAREDLSPTGAVAAATAAVDATSEPSAAADKASASPDAAPIGPSTSPDLPTAKERASPQLRAAEVPAGSSTALPSTSLSNPPSNPIVPPIRPSFARNSDAPAPQPATQPLIHMDVPRDRILDIRLPPGYQPYFFRLPIERVLESPSATMYIERSVRIPAAHMGWPFARNKRVVVGELIARVDPLPAEIPASSASTVRILATVAKNGRIRNLRPILGPPDLVPAALKALREWRYQPTLVDNKPVETQCYVVIQFHAPQYHSAQR